MIIGRLIGRLVLLAALAVFCRDLFGWYELRVYMPVSLGRLWSALHVTSSEVFLAKSPGWLNPALSGLLDLPAAMTLAVLALLIIWACRRRTGRRRR